MLSRPNRQKWRILGTTVSLVVLVAVAGFGYQKYIQHKKDLARADIKEAWTQFVESDDLDKEEKPLIDAAVAYWSTYFKMQKNYAAAARPALETKACQEGENTRTCRLEPMKFSGYEMYVAMRWTIKDNPVDGFYIDPPEVRRKMMSENMALMAELYQGYMTKIESAGYDSETALSLVDIGNQSYDDLFGNPTGPRPWSVQAKWSKSFVLDGFEKFVRGVKSQREVSISYHRIRLPGLYRPPLCERDQIKNLAQRINWCKSTVELGIIKNREKPF